MEAFRPKVFDVALNPKKIYVEFFTKGYVVVKNVSTQANRDKLVAYMDDLVANSPAKLVKNRGFLDLYHDDTLAQLRQDRRIMKPFELIFKRSDLWVVFDRLIYQGKHDKAIPLCPHVDQNPLKGLEFKSVQAILALRDMKPGQTDMLVVAEKSQQHFSMYKAWAKPSDGFVEAQAGYMDCELRLLELHEGEMVIWDSRLTHFRNRIGNTTTHNRYGMLISFLPQTKDPMDLALRQTIFDMGVGGVDHTAGLRATASPRCPISLRKHKENLTEHGRRIYGLDDPKDPNDQD